MLKFESTLPKPLPDLREARLPPAPAQSEQASQVEERRQLPGVLPPVESERIRVGENLRMLLGVGRSVENRRGIYLAIDPELPAESRSRIESVMRAVFGDYQSGIAVNTTFKSANEHIAAEGSQPFASKREVAVLPAVLHVKSNEAGGIQFELSSSLKNIERNPQQPILVANYRSIDEASMKDLSLQLAEKFTKGGSSSIVGNSRASLADLYSTYTINSDPSASKLTATPDGSRTGKPHADDTSVYSFFAYRPEDKFTSRTVIATGEQLRALKGGRIEIDGTLLRVTRTTSIPSSDAPKSGEVPAQFKLSRETVDAGSIAGFNKTEVYVNSFPGSKSETGTTKEIEFSKKALAAEFPALQGIKITHEPMRALGNEISPPQMPKVKYRLATDGDPERTRQLAESPNGKAVLESLASGLAQAERNWGAPPNTFVKGIAISSMLPSNAWIQDHAPDHLSVSPSMLSGETDRDRQVTTPASLRVIVNHEFWHVLDKSLNISTGRPTEVFDRLKNDLTNARKEAVDAHKQPQLDRRPLERYVAATRKQEQYFSAINEQNSYSMAAGGHSGQSILEHTSSHLQTHTKPDWSSWISRQNRDVQVQYMEFTEAYLEKFAALQNHPKGNYRGVKDHRVLLEKHRAELQGILEAPRPQ